VEASRVVKEVLVMWPALSAGRALPLGRFLIDISDINRMSNRHVTSHFTVIDACAKAGQLTTTYHVTSLEHELMKLYFLNKNKPVNPVNRISESKLGN
jgi:hypothetical protein